METGGQIPIQGNAQVVKMGEDKAFDFFFRQYYTALCFFANSILHDEDEARDLVQDCFVKLWNCQTISERSDTVKSFLYTMVRNQCLNVLKKRKVILKAKKQLKLNETEADFEFFDEVVFAETIRQILRHIDELPTTMQKVFKLYYLEGKNYKQIAGEVNYAPETVRKQKAKALKILRQKIIFLLMFASFIFLMINQ